METKYGLPEQVLFCKRCVISNQRPNSTQEYSHVQSSKKQTIHFDAEGVCDACRVAENKASINWGERERELREVCNRFRSRDGAYDCVVPGSGGKDSFYAASVLKEKYGMHPLLITWAAHIYTDWGMRNLQRWQGIADHFLCTPRRDTHRLLTRLAVDNLFHPFQPFIIGQKSLAPKMAVLHKIPLVWYGEPEGEYGNAIAETMIPERDAGYYTSDAVHLGGVSVGDLRKHYQLSNADLAPYMPASPDDLKRVGVTVKYLGYYLKWRPQQNYYYAVEHGNFEAAPERTPGTWSKYSSIDDVIDDVHYWTTAQKFGIGRATYDAAQEIRSGEITREEGVALVKKYDGEWPARFMPLINEYLSVNGFEPFTDQRWHDLAVKFRPNHLWDGDKLRHTVK